MPKYFVSFQQQSAFRDLFVEINAPTLSEAQEAVTLHFASSCWCNIYDEESFTGQPEKFGLRRLATMTVNRTIRPRVENINEGKAQL